MAKIINSKDINDAELYTVLEAAAILEVTAQTVSKYLRNGELKGQKKGPKDKWHVPGSALKKILKDWNMLG